MTPLQRKKEAILRKELKDRRDTGESNLFIRRGQLVTVNPRVNLQEEQCPNKPESLIKIPGPSKAAAKESDDLEYSMITNTDTDSSSESDTQTEINDSSSEESEIYQVEDSENPQNSPEQQGVHEVDGGNDGMKETENVNIVEVAQIPAEKTEILHQSNIVTQELSQKPSDETVVLEENETRVENNDDTEEKQSEKPSNSNRVTRSKNSSSQNTAQNGV